MAKCQEYFDAWNRRDADAILATFGPSGDYRDPTTPGPIAGPQLAGYVQALWAAFPDLSFDVVSVAPTSGSTVAAQWLMRGHNHGSFNGLPPTGKAVELPGSDFFTVGEDGIESVTGYFDSGTLPRQLGLQVDVKPFTLGPFEFGDSVRLQSGSTARPGAFSVTQLQARSDDEVEVVRDFSRRIGQEMLSMEGFITLTTMTVGRRMMTITAWEKPEQIRAIYENATHAEAMQKFFGADIASGGLVSSLAPQHVSLTIRCADCEAMTRVDGAPGETTCACGASLAESRPWW